MQHAFLLFKYPLVHINNNKLHVRLIFNYQDLITFKIDAKAVLQAFECIFLYKHLILYAWYCM